MSDHDSNTDSAFLDMITNCVGILIILVMVVGQRAHEAPALLAAQRQQQELEAAQAEAAAIGQDVQQLQAQLAVAESELRSRASERGDVNTFIAALERDLEDRRAEMSAKSREQYDTSRELAQLQNELARLESERERAESTIVPVTINVESFPTPIGKTVEGKEAHFQLRGGRIAFVPFDALLDRLKATMREQIAKFDAPSDTIDTLEPIGGFRMRYALERFNVRGGVYVGISYIELLPVSSQLGEPINVALAPRSKFRDRMEMLSPRQYTITVWTYPDSFAEYRQLKKELYSLGYSVAVRPLPEGMPIGASPHGSKSSAE